MLDRFARHGYREMTDAEKHRLRAALFEALELARAGQRLRATKAGLMQRYKAKLRLKRELEAAMVPPSTKEPVAEMPPEYWPTREDA